jgi:hypothetical protein
MKEEELKPFYGKLVKVTCNDNSIIIGTFYGFTYAEDNDNGITSVDIQAINGLIEVYLNEIKSIEIAK